MHGTRARTPFLGISAFWCEAGGSLAHLGVPKGPPLGTLVRHVSLFLMFFWVFFSKLITKENVVLIQYLLCSKHIYLLKKGWQVYKFDAFLRTHLGAALGVDFRRIWGRFWELSGTLKAPKYCKRGSKKQLKNRTSQKWAKSHVATIWVWKCRTPTYLARSS